MSMLASLTKMREAIEKNPSPELISAYEALTGETWAGSIATIPEGVISDELCPDLSTSDLQMATPEGKIEDPPTVRQKANRISERRKRRNAERKKLESFGEDEDDFTKKSVPVGKKKKKSRRSEVNVEGRQAVSEEFRAPKKLNFFDDPNEAVADREFDKARPCPHSPRARKPFKKVKVRCQHCYKIERVSPALVKGRTRFTDRYICNKCSSRGG